MASFIPGYLVKEVRTRKRWQQDQLLYQFQFETANLSRVENAHQRPTGGTFRSLMNEMGVLVESLFYYHFENQTMDAFVIRDQILGLLDDPAPEDCKEVEVLLQALESRGGFEYGINRQFIVSCQAQLNEVRALNPDDTVALAKEGMALTYEEFDENDFEGDMLIFEEITLLHTLAKAYYRQGKATEAIALLYSIQKGITRLPEDDREKERKLAPVLLTLTDFLIQEKRHEDALKMCLLGNEASIKRNKGKYTPEFLYCEAICSHHLGNTDKCRKLAQLAYFGYALFRKKDRAEAVRKNAKKYFGVQFNTYGVEDLVYENFDSTISHGGSKACEHIGALINNFCIEAGLSDKELYQGICTHSNYNKIKNGNIKDIKFYYLEAFMQRLGRDIDKYLNTFLTLQDFKDKQMRNEINSRLDNSKFEEAAELLEELKEKKGYKKGVNLQFVKLAEVTILGSREGYGHLEYLEKLKRALAITRPDFDEELVHKYHLSYYEIVLINQIAMYYGEVGDLKRSTSLFERLRSSMDRYFIDEKEKIRMYATVLYNYSKDLGLMGRYKEALEVVHDGEIAELKHGRLTLLPSLAINRAYNLAETGKKEESVPIFALAYYGSVLLGKDYNKQAIEGYVLERLGIVFD